MQQDMIVILDLGSTENTVLARAVRDLGVYSEIYPHDITPDELRALPNVRGILLNGGPNRVVDGAPVDVDPVVYSLGIPTLSADHPTARGEALPHWPKDPAALTELLRGFVFDTCKAQANWNMENFIADQIELVRKQVGSRKVLLALSGGVDSSVVAALLLRAIGDQLTCARQPRAAPQRGAEQVVRVFRDELGANLVYVDASERFWASWQGSRTPSRNARSSARSSSASSRRRPASSRGSTSRAGHHLSRYRREHQDRQDGKEPPQCRRPARRPRV
ncbi:MAG: glutamine amidotransferase-related protein [Anaerotruncus massiliensis (ex Togo et al. 2019)]